MAGGENKKGGSLWIHLYVSFKIKIDKLALL